MGRKEELIRYIHLLKDLSNDGFSVNVGLNQALKELHELMLPVINKKLSSNPKTPKLLIVVLEDDSYEVNRATVIFESLLGNSIISKKIANDSSYFQTDSAEIAIFKLNDDMDRHRGIRANYIIDNTSGKFAVDFVSLIE